MTTEPEHLIANLAHSARQAAESLGLQWATHGRTAGDTSWQTYAKGLDALDELLRVARRVRGEMEAQMAPLMPREATVVPGVGLVAKHGSGKKTSWDVDGLRHAVSERLGARLSDDPTVLVDSDGCTLPPREIALRATARTVEEMIGLCGMTGSTAWRSGPLESLGINPKEYKASDWAGWKVTIEPNIVDTTEAARS